MNKTTHSVVCLKDLEKAYELIDKYNKAIGYTVSDEELDLWIKKIIRIGDPLGIIVDNEIIAFLLLYCNKYDTLEAYICNVYVLEKDRGKGLSMLMIERAIEICRERGFKTIVLDVAQNNTSAIRVYTKCGFIEAWKYLKDSEPYQRMLFRV